MKKLETSWLGPALILCSSLLFSACSQAPQTNEPAAAAANAEQSVAFDLDLSAMHTDPSQNVFNDFTVKAVSPDLVNGTMTITDLDTLESVDYPWSVILDENNLANVQSLRTLSLAPAQYEFSLVLTKGDQQYVGATIHAVTDGAEDAITMLLSPVIGDTLIDVNQLTQLVDFTLNYPDIQNTSIDAPTLGVTIDGEPEEMFILDPDTGLSGRMYLALLPGDYSIELRLVDNGVQVGKSNPTQGNSVTVNAGGDVTMDIMPLYGEVSMIMFAFNGDANFEVLVPGEVVDEAGGLNNLEASVTIFDANNQSQTQVLSLEADGDNYKASTVMTQVAFGQTNFQMNFLDLTTGDPIGHCVDSLLLSSSDATVDCALTLIRRSFIGGSLLSTVGLNVFDVDGNPVSNAVVSIDGVNAAITNSTDISTPGYSKLYVKPGTRVISATTTDGLSGQMNFTAQPLEVTNIDLIIQ